MQASLDIEDVNWKLSDLLANNQKDNNSSAPELLPLDS